MARVRGPNRLIGRVGERTNYTIKGVDGIISRLATGPSKEMIDSLPQYSETKKNALTFGDCSKAMKLIRQPFGPVIEKVRRPFEHSRFLGYGYEIFRNARSGDRHPFETDSVRKFKGYRFNRDTDLMSILMSETRIEIDDEVLRLEAKGYAPSRYHRASHFAFTLSVAGIDFEENRWEASHSQSDFIAFNALNTMEPLSVETKLPRGFPVTFVVLMLNQLDYINGSYSWFYNGNYSAANIIEVFGEFENEASTAGESETGEDWRKWLCE